MTINLIDARRGLHNKCLELFADKKIAEQIYRYLCDGIEDCEEAEPIKHGRWIVETDCEGKTRRCICNRCGFKTGRYTWENPEYCENCGAKMDLGEVEE